MTRQRSSCACSGPTSPAGDELNGDAGEDPLVSLGNSPAGWAYTTRKPLLLQGQSGEKWPFEMPPQFADSSLRSGCWIPLIGREGVIGTLNVFSRRAGNFTDDDVNMLSQIAGQVAIALGNALAFRHISELRDQLAEQKQYLEDELKTEFNFEEIVGQSKPIRRVLKQIETVAPTDSTVLILGETGTGKELLARAVHNLSLRRDHSFVRVNCASIPAGLLESELFGHEKGSSPAPLRRASDGWNLLTRGRFFSMRWGTSRSSCSQNSCGRCRRRNSKGWAARAPLPAMFASSPPPASIWGN